MAPITPPTDPKIDQAIKKRILNRILLLEQRNLNTQHHSPAQMVEKIKQIIQDEVDAHQFH